MMIKGIYRQPKAQQCGNTRGPVSVSLLALLGRKYTCSGKLRYLSVHNFVHCQAVEY
jgi:hypothetical protein